MKRETFEKAKDLDNQINALKYTLDAFKTNKLVFDVSIGCGASNDIRKEIYEESSPFVRKVVENKIAKLQKEFDNLK